MGTRAVYVFKDIKEDAMFHAVYKHWDSYPAGAAGFFVKALGNSWDLPRYEADEFAAAFVAANKSGPGDVRLTNNPEYHSDLEYVYELFQAKNGQLIIQAFSVNFWETNKERTEIFYGRLKDFVREHGSEEDKKAWDEIDGSPNKLVDNKDAAEYKEYLRLKAKYQA